VGKSYSYLLTDAGSIDISLIYPGKIEQEVYAIYFPGSQINYNPKLVAAVENMNSNDVLIFNYTIDGEEVTGTLTEFKELASSL